MKTYKVREVTINRIIRREITQVQEVMILINDSRYSDILIPSKLTYYIFAEFSGGYSINTKLKNARVIVEFINYLNDQVRLNEDNIFESLKYDGLSYLNLEHLARYLNYISYKRETINSYDTVKEKEKILIRFYYYLNRKKITKNNAKIEVKIIPNNQNKYKSRTGRRIMINPFNDKSKYIINYPSKQKINKKLKDLDKEVWTQFIEYAEKYYPEIAFGVAIQCMGGLRQGEVINITIEDIKADKKENNMMINIQDRPELFIDRNISINKSQIKKRKSREQKICNLNDRLFEIYENHLNYISNKRSKNSIDKGAIFINSRGEPMSGNSYETKFRKLKLDFIEEVKKYSPSLANQLENHKWGSHIGRHIFTNYFIKEGYFEGIPDEVAIKYIQSLRGDDNPASSKEYFDSHAVYKGVSKNINKISEAAKKNRR